ncbi:unnamed protein product, partial [Effrenium voratum]
DHSAPPGERGAERRPRKDHRPQRLHRAHLVLHVPDHPRVGDAQHLGVSGGYTKGPSPAVGGVPAQRPHLPGRPDPVQPRQ